MDIGVIGAGPAGLSLALFLKGTKHTVTVYESMKDVGLKPCAWGLINELEGIVHIPKEAVISEIKGFRIFLDNRLVHDIRVKKGLGLIVDKPLFLRIMAQQVDVIYDSPVSKRSGTYLNAKSSKILTHDLFIDARGHYSLSKESTIPALQYLVQRKVDMEVVDFYFYSDMLGYAWSFPDRIGCKVGIGGDKDPQFLRERLKSLIDGRTLMLQGAKVSDYGILEDRLREGKYIGESLGAVFPMTGEGIRPSILSSRIMADSILNGRDFAKEFKKTKLHWAIQAQAKIVKRVKRNPGSLKGLARILTKSDPDLVLRVAIGDFTRADTLRLFGRALI